MINGNVECLTVHLEKALVAAVYRHPQGNKSSFIEFYDRLLGFLTSESLPYFLMGDINIDTLADTLHAADFNETSMCYGCTNFITLPTRVTLESATSIDICVTNLSTSDTMAGIFTQDISDHFPIFALPLFPTIAKEQSKNHFNIADEALQKINDLVDNEDWSAVYFEENPNLAYREFLVKIRQLVYDDAFPLTISRKRKNKACKP